MGHSSWRLRAIWQFGYLDLGISTPWDFSFITGSHSSWRLRAIWQFGYLAIWIWESALPRISPLQLDRTPRGVSGQFGNLAIWQFRFGNQHSLGFLLFNWIWESALPGISPLFV